MNGVNRFNIHRDYGSKDRLPSSHTCFNRKFAPAVVVKTSIGLTMQYRARPPRVRDL